MVVRRCSGWQLTAPVSAAARSWCRKAESAVSAAASLLFPAVSPASASSPAMKGAARRLARPGSRVCSAAHTSCSGHEAEAEDAARSSDRRPGLAVTRGSRARASTAPGLIL